MNRLFFITFSLFSLIFSAFADSFDEGVFRYTILSSSDRTVEISAKSHIDHTLEIPSKVVHNSKTYNVVRIAKDGFYDQQGIRSVIIPDGVTLIGESAFSLCKSLMKVNLPNTLTHINKLAFSECDKLEDFKLPENIYYIGPEALKSLRTDTIYIPASCRKIAQDAFLFVKAFEVNPENSTYCSIDGILYEKFGLDRLALYYCPHSIDKPLEIPDSVIYIARFAFCDCSKIPSIKFPESLLTIGGLEYCSDRISCHATFGTFGGCNSITEINIPKSVWYIDEYAFAECDNIQNIYLNWDTPLLCPNLGWTDNVIMNSTLYVPKGSLELYKTSDSWRDFWNIKEYDVNGINDVPCDKNSVSKMYDIEGKEVKSIDKGSVFIRNGKKYIQR